MDKTITFYDSTHTIFAEMTLPGRSSLAVFRLSGDLAATACTALIGNKLPTPRIAYFSALKDPVSNEVIDHGIILWIPGPNSFTGEDVVEFHVHGGRSIRETLIRILGSMPGMRIAEPGEFSARAFTSGKIDLTEAEGIADLVNADTDMQRVQALRQMSGGLKNLYGNWRDRLIKNLAHLEAEIDFSDEQIPKKLRNTVEKDIRVIVTEIKDHLEDGHRGERLRDGIKVALLGPPNVGKSSLLNVLAGKDKAIVSSFSGTTRDIVQVDLDIGGIPITLSDTAGIHKASGEVEKEGIKRSLKEADDCDIRIVILDIDGYHNISPEVATLIDQNTIIIINKVDLKDIEVNEIHIGKLVYKISCMTGLGIDNFVNKFEFFVREKYGIAESPVITRERHRMSVKTCLDCLVRFLAVEDIEFAAEELRLAMRALGRITGHVDIEDILDVVFKDFCIGK